MEGRTISKDQLSLDLEVPLIEEEVKIVDGKLVLNSVKKASKYISSFLF